MNLSTSDLNTLCQTAITAAKKAGQLIQAYADKNVTINTKTGADSLASQVVTEVDVKAQDIILEILTPTLEKYDLALLTEESIDDKSRFKRDYFWCIDPMDGTLAFTEKTPGYAVSIALVSKQGESQLGVVFNPATNTLYHAIKNCSAYKNEKLWHPDLSFENKETFNLYIDRSFEQHSYYSKIMLALENNIRNLGFANINIEKFAGAVLNACWVIDKAPGCYFKIPKPQTGGGSLWDFAATACIISEAGAYGKSLDGSPLDLNRPDSTFMNHKGVFYCSNQNIANKLVRILKG
jgi:3'(2'), 5'-bisphosphate nucleotidase/myo-inositol-1(or 4)-monophosphatase